MRSVLALTAALLLLPAAARAASFDCAKASTPIEHQVCSDPVLSGLDADLAAAWRAALASSPTPASLRREQRRWLTELGPSNGDLRQAYRDRIAELKALTAAAVRLRRPFPIASLKSACVPVQAELACRVAGTGELATGSAGPLWWQHQDLVADDMTVGEGMVFLRPNTDRRTATPLAWRAEESAFFAPPSMVASPAGHLLEIQGHYDGTGDFNAGSVFRAEADRLVELDAESWRETLDRRLPKGLQVWKGVYIDYRRLAATTPLWRAGDANCCPTAGRAQLSFRIAGDAVVLQEVKIARGAAAAGR